MGETNESLDSIFEEARDKYIANVRKRLRVVTSTADISESKKKDFGIFYHWGGHEFDTVCKNLKFSYTYGDVYTEALERLTTRIRTHSDKVEGADDPDTVKKSKPSLRRGESG